jgi:hypothetical protein
MHTDNSYGAVQMTITKNSIDFSMPTAIWRFFIQLYGDSKLLLPYIEGTLAQSPRFLAVQVPRDYQKTCPSFRLQIINDLTNNTKYHEWDYHSSFVLPTFKPSYPRVTKQAVYVLLKMHNFFRDNCPRRTSIEGWKVRIYHDHHPIDQTTPEEMRTRITRRRGNK